MNQRIMEQMRDSLNPTLTQTKSRVWGSGIMGQGVWVEGLRFRDRGLEMLPHACASSVCPCVCVCVRERESVCVYERESERESVCERVKESVRE